MLETLLLMSAGNDAELLRLWHWRPRKLGPGTRDCLDVSESIVVVAADCGGVKDAHKILCLWAQTVLRELLIPRQWKPSEDRSFFLDAEQVNTLCDQAERVFLEEPTVLRLRGAPTRPPWLPGQPCAVFWHVPVYC